MRKTIEQDIPDIPNDPPLHVKYRPTTLKQVYGQKQIVESLQGVLNSSTRPHSFLFTGPSGTGKTTLARILASEFGCLPSNIIETDAATNTGIDAMREVTSTLRFQGFGQNPGKMIILDEAHGLSKQAFQSILKVIEEPPPHVYFALCTTDPGKIPETIQTRCLTYALKSLRYDDIMDLLEMVAEEETLVLAAQNGYLELVARACEGSPRKALVMLAMVANCRNADEAAELLESPLDNAEIIDLCRMLVKGDLTWPKVATTLKALNELPAESIRIVVVNYLNSCLLGAKERDVPRLLDMLSAFSKPCNPSDKLAGILLALGNLIYPA